MKAVEITIPEVYYPLFDNTHSADGNPKTIILSSGRVTGKTTSNDYAAVADIMQGRGDIWYARSELTDIRASIFTSIQAAIYDMGAAAEFEASMSPFEIRHLPTGNKIQFFAINRDINRTKGRIPPTRYLKRVILEEANEPDLSMYVDALHTTAVRYMDSRSKEIYAYNPPPLKTHWSHAYYAQKVREGAQRIYATWEDIAELLNPATIQDIERMKISDPLFYRYWYLGEVVNFSGMIYPQFKRETHVINMTTLFQWFNRGDKLSELYLGVDEGTINDSTCVTALAVLASGRAVVLDCFERCPHREGQASPSEQAKDLYDWWGRFCVQFPDAEYIPRLWYFDCAEGGQQLELQFRQDTGEPTGHVEKKNIWGDIKRVRSMLSDGALFFLITPYNTTEVLCEDLESYVIDEERNDIKKGQRDDTIDSLEYATKLYYDRPIA